MSDEEDREAIRNMAREAKRARMAGATRQEVDDLFSPPVAPGQKCVDCGVPLNRNSKRKLCSACRQEHRHEWEAMVKRLDPAVPKDVPGRPDTCCRTCYEIAPHRWVHHVWNGCTTPMPKFTEIHLEVADCGCVGTICQRCWFCKDHCQCLNGKKKL